MLGVPVKAGRYLSLRGILNQPPLCGSFQYEMSKYTRVTKYINICHDHSIKDHT